MRRLYELGIVHDDLNRYNFLVSEGRVTLINFAEAYKLKDPEVFKVELGKIEEGLGREA